MYFDKEFPIFSIPKDSKRDYSFFELKREKKNIKFFCPERQNNIDSAVWYFYVEFIEEKGNSYILPGQVRVIFNGTSIFQAKGIPKFIDVLEKVKIHNEFLSV